MTYWIIDTEGNLTNPEFIGIVRDGLTLPAPASAWQIDQEVNLGYPFITIFPDNVRIHVEPVKQKPYIHVYSIRTSQLGFDTNGIAILTPTSCEETEELCGMWSVSLEHPVDEDGKYQLLVEGNILRVNDQLFTIKRTEESWDGSTGRVSVYAEHIFYQLCDEWIFAWAQETKDIKAKTGQLAINQILGMAGAYSPIPGGQMYNYTGYSDMVYNDSLYYAILDNGCTPVDLILGENGIIAAKGGELYRDNFYFSVCRRKEDARDNAFDIRIGKNLRGIRRTIDSSSMCTYYHVTDSDTGGIAAVGWDTAPETWSFWRDYLPHHIVRSEQFSFPEGTDFRYERLVQEMFARWYQVCMPIICYEIDLEDVRQNPDFSMILGDESIRVGDIGRVYDPRLGGEIQLEITQTTYDRITGKCTSIVVGNKASFVYHPTARIVQGEPKFMGGDVWVQDSTGRYLYDKNGVKIMMHISADE